MVKLRNTFGNTFYECKFHKYRELPSDLFSTNISNYYYFVFVSVRGENEFEVVSILFVLLL